MLLLQTHLPPDWRVKTLENIAVPMANQKREIPL